MYFSFVLKNIDNEGFLDDIVNGSGTNPVSLNAKEQAQLRDMSLGCGDYVRRAKALLTAYERGIPASSTGADLSLSPEWIESGWEVKEMNGVYVKVIPVKSTYDIRSL